MINAKTKEMLQFHLESVAAGGDEMIVDGVTEIVGEGNYSWDVSVSDLCGVALDRIRELEKREQDLAAHVALIRSWGGMQRAKARGALGADDEDHRWPARHLPRPPGCREAGGGAGWSCQDGGDEAPDLSGTLAQEHGQYLPLPGRRR